MRLLVIFLLWTNWVAAQRGEMLTKRYNEVTFLATHNAYNAKVYGLKFPNQYLSVTNQLKGGVRAFLLDIYLQDSAIVQYHSKKWLGSVPFESTLGEIRQYLDTDSTAIITLILESYVPAEALVEALKDAHLFDRLYSKKDGVWPVLNEMVESDQRLVIFSEKRANVHHFPWMHYAWEFMADTPYRNYRIKKLNETINRGKAENELFLLNHFVYANKLGIGSRRKARKINQLSEITKRIESVQKLYHRTPNFIAIDFFSEDLGELQSIIQIR